MTVRMEVDPQAGTASRHAALLAHALAPRDQAWLLASLPPPRRRALQALLTELRDLGLPPDAAVLKGLTREAAPEPLQVLGRRQIRVLAGLLQGEPPALAARLLAMRRWTWRPALLAAMGPGFVAAARAGAVMAPAPALDAALREALARQLASINKGATRVDPRHLWWGAVDAVRRLGARP